MQLRDYQLEAIAAFRKAASEGVRRAIIASPCGTGKTITGLALAKQMGARTLWAAHRSELITQPIAALKYVWPGAQHGVIKAERDEHDAQDIVFASVQTAWRRPEHLSGFDLVVADEAHHFCSDTFKAVLDHAGCFRDDGPLLLGLTATPERTDQQRLDDIFQQVAYQFQLQTAIERGYLVPPVLISRKLKIDIDGVPVRQGDLAPGQLDEALLEGGIVTDVCRAVEEHAAGRKTLVFVVSVRQAKLVAKQLQGMGVAADSVDGNTPLDQRRDALAAFSKGETRVMVGVDLFLEGYDEPTIDCIVMARPTTSKPLCIQALGRGLRLSPGKTDCKIIDMVCISKRHTLVQAPVIFGLDKEEEEREPSERDEERARDAWASRLASQVKGVPSMAWSALCWLEIPNGYTLNAGQGGTVVMRTQGLGWTVEARGRQGGGVEMLATEPVGLELAQGIAEDYVRRCEAVNLTSRSAEWRDLKPTEKQLAALKRWRIDVPNGIDRGTASDLLTQKSATDWRRDAASPKQLAALDRMGIKYEKGITKGQAGRLLARGRW